MEENFVKMNIDEMKSAKEGWQTWLQVSKRLLKKIQNMDDVNRWEIKSLEMSYNLFIDQMKKIVSIYGEMIDLAEFCDLEIKEFNDGMRKIRKANAELRKEYNRKTFRELNNKYIHGIKEAEVINGL